VGQLPNKVFRDQRDGLPGDRRGGRNSETLTGFNLQPALVVKDRLASGGLDMR
jgi:hypothetical protein